ncbi:hypothetical protein [Motiliproteus sediminis]|uniref:hypothetical protein n=1 Tax=Motiliproteus sediminis TaxID=1468178 RepID=UPI001AEF9316|nr:hypothetical protein [Motiliproteus sediminis]
MNSLDLRLDYVPTMALLLLLAGCSSSPSPRWIVGEGQEQRCQTLLTEMERRVDRAGVRDPFGHYLYRYPYLRSSRWLHHWGSEVISSEQGRTQWLQAMRVMADQARGIELDNLPPELRFQPAERQQLEDCVDSLALPALATTQHQAAMLEQAAIDDSYSSLSRTLGLFALTRQVVLHQISIWQAEWGARFNDPSLLKGGSRVYPPASSTLPAVGGYQSAVQHLPGAPALTDQQWQDLVARHAPVWQLFYHSGDDRLGRPYWQGGQVRVETSDPVSYVLPSLTRFEGENLLQLNYWIWLPARTPVRVGDIYAGRLDGLIWRVTLNSDGKVLLYDSIHACGCYHLMFPVDPELRQRPQDSQTEVPLILPFRAPERALGRPLLQLLPGSHYLMGVRLWSPSAGLGSPYRFDHYHRLRRLPSSTGRRNLFSANGLVEGTERPERWLLWPMGVASAGAMRSWGHHAISFANRRHFDDPTLLEALFTRKGAPE